MNPFNYRFKLIYSIGLLSLFTFPCFAETNTVEFFFSNNNHIIDIQKAYVRLVGSEQKKLTRSAIEVLQNQHMEQGDFKSMLGTYTLQSDHKTTADNTEVFFSSPLQNLSQEKIFSVAASFANQLNQESVAVLIPSKSNDIAHIKLVFLTNRPAITNAIKLIQDKLPESYSQAFSLNLSKARSGFNLAEVKSIEWLGNNLNNSIIKNLFPKDKVLSFSGESFLVFKDGKWQKL